MFKKFSKCLGRYYWLPILCEVRNDNAALEIDIANLRNENKELVEKFNNLADQFFTLKNEHNDLVERKEKLIDRNVEQQKEIAGLEGQIEVLVQQISDDCNKRNALESTIRSLNCRIGGYVAAIKRMKNKETE